MFRFPLSRSRRKGSLKLENIEVVLFDLDGTLIDVDMQRFIPLYLRRLTERLGILSDPRRVTEVMRRAVAEMLRTSDGQATMEAILLSHLDAECDISATAYQACLAQFVIEDLPTLQPLVKAHPLACKLLESCLNNGWQVALATNPIFPKAVVDARLAWGGLEQIPFSAVTAYEASRYCKPHPGYFLDLMSTLDVTAKSCLMVGNDTEHDLAAGQVGLQTCLLTTWRLDRAGGHYSADWEGYHDELLALFRGTGGVCAPVCAEPAPD